MKFPIFCKSKHFPDLLGTLLNAAAGTSCISKQFLANAENVFTSRKGCIIIQNIIVNSLAVVKAFTKSRSFSVKRPRTCSFQMIITQKFKITNSWKILSRSYPYPSLSCHTPFPATSLLPNSKVVSLYLEVTNPPLLLLPHTACSAVAPGLACLNKHS